VRQYAQVDSAIQEAMSEVVAGAKPAQAALDAAASKVAALMKS
jgi:maltose-binding protein MalE